MLKNYLIMIVQRVTPKLPLNLPPIRLNAFLMLIHQRTLIYTSHRVQFLCGY